MKMSPERMEELRERRRLWAQAREYAESRASFGAKLATAVAVATEKPLSLEDFDTSKREPLVFDWPRAIENASGLVAAYISMEEAHEVLACVRTRLGTLSGEIGFHDKPYLGLASVSEVDPLQLLALSEATEESVLLYSAAPFGVLMVDCYYSCGEPFSIVVQGDELVHQLADCFPAKR